MANGINTTGSGLLQSKKFIVLVIIAVVLIGAGAYWFLKGPGAVNRNNLTSKTSNGQQEGEGSADDADSAQSEASTVKDPAPPTTITATEPPLVYTGYGHVSASPLPLDQETSTSCTSVPGVSCYIKLTNNSTGQEVQFDAQNTDAQGVALWNWKGSDVGSGEWSVRAVASGLESGVEIIYVQ